VTFIILCVLAVIGASHLLNKAWPDERPPDFDEEPRPRDSGHPYR
jgi:hypothetical protein